VPVKLDLRKEYKSLYTAPTAGPVLIQVPTMQYLMVDGQGDPNTSSAYRGAVEALYGLAYTLKFAAKRGPAAVDFPVMALEGLWWADDMADFLRGSRENWRWTAMIMQPPLITEAMLSEARTQLAKKGDVPGLGLARLAAYDEGLSAQIMHVGPYAAEAPTIEHLHRFIAEQGYRPAGKHHEIYLGDPRRSAPERLRTLIRQPVAR